MTIGCLGTLGENSHVFLHSAFSGLANLAEDEQTKLLHITSLHGYLDNGNPVTLAVTVPSIIISIQGYLDEIPGSQYKLLPPTVIFLAKISAQFPRIFDPYFQDIVDLLVGWTLDADLPHGIKKNITVHFTKFEALWVQHLPFSTTLFGRLAADMESLATAITDENIGRLLSLASCFVGVAEGIGKTYALRGGDMVPRFLALITSVHSQMAGRSKFWTDESTDCISKLAQVLDANNIRDFNAPLLDIAIEQLTPMPMADNALAQLQLLRRLWKTIGHQAAGRLFHVGSSFLQLRVHPDIRVKRCVMLLVKSSLDTCSNASDTHQMDAASAAAASGMSTAIVHCLRDEMRSFHEALACPQTAPTPSKGAFPRAQGASGDLFCWDLSIFSLIATPSDSSTAALALEILTTGFDAFSSEVFVTRPKLQIALVRAIFSLHHRLGYQTMAGVPQENQLAFMKGLLSGCLTSNLSQLKVMAIEWIEDFLLHPGMPGSSTARVLLLSSFPLLLNCARHLEPALRLRVGTCVKRVLHTSSELATERLCQFTRVAIDALADQSALVRNAYKAILGYVGPVALLESRAALESALRKNRKWKCQLLCAPSPCRFSGPQFTKFIQFLGQRADENLDGWLTRMLYICLPKSAEVSSQVMADTYKLAAVDARVGDFWAILESARYCVTCRLRTPLGGPMQTFQSIERILVEISTHASIGFGLDGPLKSEPKRILRAVHTSADKTGSMRAQRLLIDFVDLLEKHVYNAYEGSVSLPSPSKNSLMFFVGNRKVCEDWFARMRPHMAMSSMTCNALEAAARYSFQCIRRVLRDRGQFTDVEEHLLRMSRGLCVRREADALRGLAGWSRGLLHSKYPDRHPASLLWMQGLVSHAHGQYENAIRDYDKFLSANDIKHLSVSTVGFVVNQMTECYVSLGDWAGLDGWLSALKQYRMQFASTHLQASFETVIDSNYLSALCKFDMKDFITAGAHLDLTPPPEADSQDVASRLRDSENVSLQVMVSIAMGFSDAQKLRHSLQISRRSLDDPLFTGSTESPVDAGAVLVQLRCLQALETSIDLAESGGPRSNPGSVSTQFDDSSVYGTRGLYSEPEFQDCGQWVKIVRVLNLLVGCGLMVQSCDNLKLNLSKLACKQQNFTLAQRLLDESRESLAATYVRAVLCYEQNNRSRALQLLYGLSENFETELLQDQVLAMSGVDSGSDFPNERAELKAKVFLKLAKWLQKDSTLRIDGIEQIVTLEKLQWKSSASAASAFNALAGSRIEQATRAAPHMAKTWLRHAEWCYQEAQKSGEAVRFSLTNSEIIRIREICQQHQGADVESTVEAVSNVFHTFGGMAGRADDGGMDTMSQLHSTDVQSALATTSKWSSVIQSAVADELMRLWMSIRERTLGLHSAAVQSYFQFLSVAEVDPSKHADRLSDDSALVSAASMVDDDQNITVTLRLLRLLIKHGNSMESVLSDGFRKTPIGPWSAIIPQLFARIGHPNEYVRSQVQTLVARIGQESPHLIIWPAIVGNDSVLLDSDGATGSVRPDLESPRPLIRSICNTLNHNFPELMSEARSMISEFTRISVLWEELWMTTLNDVQNDVLGRIRRLKDELLRVSQNNSLSHKEKTRILGEKCQAIMKPVVVALERTQRLTIREAQTPHEHWFQSTFGSVIENAIDDLKSARNPWDPAALWAPFKTIWKDMSQFMKRKSLHLHDISPRLADVQSSSISMPGLPSSGTEYISVVGVDVDVEVLASKTKPKKFALVGSDGKRHSYLVKGHEDLHLDERIMQFLDIVSRMLANDRPSRARALRARHYAVIPLGPQVGLIRWVDNTAPLFQMYRGWQQRRCDKKNMTNKSADDRLAHPLRTNDMFYARIIPALKEQGMTNVASRREWPHSVLRRVLKELMNETPRDLLSNEFWCSSASQAQWWSKTQTYARSVAVMSVVGYVLGIGDRHLDNILVDLSSGEVVHIDYNVCFEKGLRLRVPEIVPFRMTQTMQAALGLTGVEGTFRSSCEHAMRVLRRNKETLLTLLEAFVYDPLVDWAAEKAAQEARKDMELSVGLSLFASRIDEFKTVMSTHALRFGELQTSLRSKILNLFQSCKAVSTARVLKKECEANLLRCCTSTEEVRQKAAESQDVLQQQDAAQADMLSETQSIKDAISQSLSQSVASHDRYTAAFEALKEGSWRRLASITEAREIWPPSSVECKSIFVFQAQHIEAWKHAMEAYTFMVGLVSDDISSRNRCVEWGRWFHELMMTIPTVEIVQAINAQASTGYMLQRMDMAHQWEQQSIAYIRARCDERDTAHAADSTFDESSYQEAVDEALADLNALDGSISMPLNKRTATGAAVMVMSELMIILTSITADYNGEISRFQLEDLLIQLQTLLSTLNPSGQRRDIAQTEQHPVSVAAGVITCVSESEDNFLSAISSVESMQIIQSVDHTSLDIVEKLSAVRQNAQSCKATYERIVKDAAEHNGFVGQYHAQAARIESQMKVLDEQLDELEGEDVSWEAIAELNDQKERLQSAQNAVENRWAGKENYYAVLVQARKATLAQIGDLEDSLAQLLSPQTEVDANGKGILSLLNKIDAVFARVQNENLLLKQSLDIDAPGGKDLGLIRVLLLERRVHTLHCVFMGDDRKEAVEAVRNFLDMYAVEVFVPHLQVLLTKLISGRAAMLAPQASFLEPIIDSARVVAQCRDALPQLEEYEQRIRTYCTATIRMHSAVRDHQLLTKSLVELDSDIEQKRVELAIMRWMNDDLLHAHELFEPMSKSGHTFDTVYLEGLGAMAGQGSGGHPAMTANDVQTLADQASGRVPATQRLSDLMANRRSLVAAVAAAHDGLLAAHEVFAKQVEDGEVSVEYAQQLEWAGNHKKALGECLQLSATIIDFEAHSSILDPKWRSMDQQNKELMGRLHRTLRSSMRFDALTAQARKYGRFAEQELQRLANEYQTSGRGVEQASVQLEKLGGSLPSLVSKAAKLLTDTTTVEMVEADHRLASEVKSLLGNVIKLTADKSRGPNKPNKPRSGGGGQRGAVSEIHRRAVKLDQDHRRCNQGLHTLVAAATEACSTTLSAKADTDPLQALNRLLWPPQPSPAGATTTDPGALPTGGVPAAADPAADGATSQWSVEQQLDGTAIKSVLEGGIDHTASLPSRLVRLGSLATRQAASEKEAEQEGEEGEEEEEDGPVANDLPTEPMVEHMSAMNDDEDVDVDVMNEQDAAAAAATVAAAAAAAMEPGAAVKAQKEEKEERSIYALAVLRRVRYKLDGRDACKLTRALTPDGERPLAVENRLSVNEHVDRIIAEAISADNLALMYEGWAAWI